MHSFKKKKAFHRRHKNVRFDERSDFAHFHQFSWQIGPLNPTIRMLYFARYISGPHQSIDRRIGTFR